MPNTLIPNRADSLSTAQEIVLLIQRTRRFEEVLLGRRYLMPRARHGQKSQLMGQGVLESLKSSMLAGQPRVGRVDLPAVVACRFSPWSLLVLQELST